MPPNIHHRYSKCENKCQFTHPRPIWACNIQLQNLGIQMKFGDYTESLTSRYHCTLTLNPEET
jgi:hypothetical protein